MLLTKRGIGTFPSYEIMEIALQDLKNNGFYLDRVSAIGNERSRHSEVIQDNVGRSHGNGDRTHDRDDEVADRAKEGALAGTAVGGITGLLVGLGLVAIPGIGPVMLAGAAATALATTISGGAIGAATGGLAGALVGLGLSDEHAQIYSDRIARGEYLVMVEGTEADMALAESIFRRHGIEEWRVYDIAADSTQTTRTTSTHNL